MPKYRKKPVVIEAFRLGYDNPERWWVEAIANDKVRPFMMRPGEAEAEIETLEGLHVARHGDWIIRGVAGELYPCKHEIFLRTYELVS